MITELRRLMALEAPDKQYLITGAPTCSLVGSTVMGPIIEAVKFDALFIQFYNDETCAASKSTFNYDQWGKLPITHSYCLFGENTVVSLYEIEN